MELTPYTRNKPSGQTHMAVVYPKDTELGDDLAPLDVEPRL